MTLTPLLTRLPQLLPLLLTLLTLLLPLLLPLLPLLLPLLLMLIRLRLQEPRQGGAAEVRGRVQHWSVVAGPHGCTGKPAQLCGVAVHCPLQAGTHMWL